MTIIDALEDIWTKILEVTALFITPDWNALIGLLPLIILLGVVAPFITFTMLGMLVYQVRKPRTKVEFAEGPRFAEIGADGGPIFPPACRTAGATDSSTRRASSAASARASSSRSPARCAAWAVTRRSTPARTAASSSR